jgi:glycerol-3-phosphate dehydrogenase/signal transduction histidine kinase/SAM-dependent methyltransferase
MMLSGNLVVPDAPAVSGDTMRKIVNKILTDRHPQIVAFPYVVPYAGYERPATHTKPTLINSSWRPRTIRNMTSSSIIRLHHVFSRTMQFVTEYGCVVMLNLFGSAWIGQSDERSNVNLIFRIYKFQNGYCGPLPTALFRELNSGLIKYLLTDVFALDCKLGISPELNPRPNQDFCVFSGEDLETREALLREFSGYRESYLRILGENNSAFRGIRCDRGSLPIAGLFVILAVVLAIVLLIGYGHVFWSAFYHLATDVIRASAAVSSVSWDNLHQYLIAAAGCVIGACAPASDGPGAPQPADKGYPAAFMSSNAGICPEENSPIYDLTVAGGGIAGVAVACEAAAMGLSVFLAERNEFGSGASSKSTGLVHAGIRYLDVAYQKFREGNFRKAWENLRFVFVSSRERRRIQKRYPHLVSNIPILIPIYRDGPYTLIEIVLGVWIYYLFSLFTGRGLPWPKLLISPRAVLSYACNLNPHGLLGGFIYWDCLTDDLALVRANIEDAVSAGACMRQNCGLEDYFYNSEEGVWYARLKDTGTKKEFMVKSRRLVNATGAWIDRTRRMTDRVKEGSLIYPLAGEHLNLRRQPTPKVSLVLQVGARHLRRKIAFLINRPDGTARLGTSERVCADFDTLEVDEEECAELIRLVNSVLVVGEVVDGDIISRDAGIRPLASEGDEADPSKVSREHKVVVDADGLINLCGVKITDHCRAAEEVVRLIAMRDSGYATPNSPNHGLCPAQDAQKWAGSLFESGSVDDSQDKASLAEARLRGGQIISAMEAEAAGSSRQLDEVCSWLSRNSQDLLFDTGAFMQASIIFDRTCIAPPDQAITAQEILSRGRGVCWDYACLGHSILSFLSANSGVGITQVRMLGLLLIVSVGDIFRDWANDSPPPEAHICLLVEHKGQWWMLNNGALRQIDAATYEDAAISIVNTWTLRGEGQYADKEIKPEFAYDAAGRLSAINYRQCSGEELIFLSGSDPAPPAGPQKEGAGEQFEQKVRGIVLRAIEGKDSGKAEKEAARAVTEIIREGRDSEETGRQIADIFARLILEDRRRSAVIDSISLAADIELLTEHNIDIQLSAIVPRMVDGYCLCRMTEEELAIVAIADLGRDVIHDYMSHWGMIFRAITNLANSPRALSSDLRSLYQAQDEHRDSFVFRKASGDGRTGFINPEKAAESISEKVAFFREQLEFLYAMKIRIQQVDPATKEAAALLRLVELTIANAEGFINAASTGELKKGEVRELDINEILSFVIDALQRPSGLTDRVRFRKRYQKGLPRVACNASELQNVFINLVSNARHALVDRKRQVITVITGKEEGFVVISVADSGCGIAPENMARIFEPYFTTRKHWGGTGLGLPIAKKAIESWGGVIGVSSVVGEGTTFTIKFPAGDSGDTTLNSPPGQGGALFGLTIVGIYQFLGGDKFILEVLISIAVCLGISLFIRLILGRLIEVIHREQIRFIESELHYQGLKIFGITTSSISVPWWYILLKSPSSLPHEIGHYAIGRLLGFKKTHFIAKYDLDTVLQGYWPYWYGVSRGEDVYYDRLTAGLAMRVLLMDIAGALADTVMFYLAATFGFAFFGWGGLIVFGFYGLILFIPGMRSLTAKEQDGKSVREMIAFLRSGDSQPHARRRGSGPQGGSVGILVIVVGMLIALLAPAIMSGQLFVVLERLWAQLPHLPAKALMAGLPANALVVGLPAPLEMLKCIFGTSFLTGPASALVAGLHLSTWLLPVTALLLASTMDRRSFLGTAGFTLFRLVSPIPVELLPQEVSPPVSPPQEPPATELVAMKFGDIVMRKFGAFGTAVRPQQEAIILEVLLRANMLKVHHHETVGDWIMPDEEKAGGYIEAAETRFGYFPQSFPHAKSMFMDCIAETALRLLYASPVRWVRLVTGRFIPSEDLVQDVIKELLSPVAIGRFCDVYGELTGSPVKGGGPEENEVERGLPPRKSEPTDQDVKQLNDDLERLISFLKSTWIYQGEYGTGSALGYWPEITESRTYPPAGQIGPFWEVDFAPFAGYPERAQKEFWEPLMKLPFNQGELFQGFFLRLREILYEYGEHGFWSKTQMENTVSNVRALELLDDFVDVLPDCAAENGKIFRMRLAELIYNYFISTMLEDEEDCIGGGYCLAGDYIYRQDDYSSGSYIALDSSYTGPPKLYRVCFDPAMWLTLETWLGEPRIDQRSKELLEADYDLILRYSPELPAYRFFCLGPNERSPRELRRTPKDVYDSALWALRDYGGLSAQDGVYDFGCGGGDFMAYLRERGCRVKGGCDISEEMAEVARGREFWVERYDCVRGNAEWWREHFSFKFGVCIDVLQDYSYRDIRKFLRFIQKAMDSWQGQAAIFISAVFGDEAFREKWEADMLLAVGSYPERHDYWGRRVGLTCASHRRNKNRTYYVLTQGRRQVPGPMHYAHFPEFAPVRFGPFRIPGECFPEASGENGPAPAPPAGPPAAGQGGTQPNAGDDVSGNVPREWGILPPPPMSRMSEEDEGFFRKIYSYAKLSVRIFHLGMLLINLYWLLKLISIKVGAPVLIADTSLGLGILVVLLAALGSLLVHRAYSKRKELPDYNLLLGLTYVIGILLVAYLAVNIFYINDQQVISIAGYVFFALFGSYLLFSHYKLKGFLAMIARAPPRPPPGADNGGPGRGAPQAKRDAEITRASFLHIIPSDSDADLPFYRFAVRVGDDGSLENREEVLGSMLDLPLERAENFVITQECALRTLREHFDRDFKRHLAGAEVNIELHPGLRQAGMTFSRDRIGYNSALFTRAPPTKLIWQDFCFIIALEEWLHLLSIRTPLPCTPTLSQDHNFVHRFINDHKILSRSITNILSDRAQFGVAADWQAVAWDIVCGIGPDMIKNMTPLEFMRAIEDHSYLVARRIDRRLAAGHEGELLLAYDGIVAAGRVSIWESSPELQRLGVDKPGIFMYTAEGDGLSYDEGTLRACQADKSTIFHDLLEVIADDFVANEPSIPFQLLLHRHPGVLSGMLAFACQFEPQSVASVKQLIRDNIYVMGPSGALEARLLRIAVESPAETWERYIRSVFHNLRVRTPAEGAFSSGPQGAEGVMSSAPPAGPQEPGNTGICPAQDDSAPQPAGPEDGNGKMQDTHKPAQTADAAAMDTLYRIIKFGLGPQRREQAIKKLAEVFGVETGNAAALAFGELFHVFAGWGPDEGEAIKIGVIFEILVIGLRNEIALSELERIIEGFDWVFEPVRTGSALADLKAAIQAIRADFREKPQEFGAWLCAQAQRNSRLWAAGALRGINLLTRIYPDIMVGDRRALLDRTCAVYSRGKFPGLPVAGDMQQIRENIDAAAPRTVYVLYESPSDAEIAGLFDAKDNYEIGVMAAVAFGKPLVLVVRGNENKTPPLESLDSVWDTDASKLSGLINVLLRVFESRIEIHDHYEVGAFPSWYVPSANSGDFHHAKESYGMRYFLRLKDRGYLEYGYSPRWAERNGQDGLLKVSEQAGLTDYAFFWRPQAEHPESGRWLCKHYRFSDTRHYGDKVRSYCSKEWHGRELEELIAAGAREVIFLNRCGGWAIYRAGLEFSDIVYLPGRSSYPEEIDAVLSALAEPRIVELPEIETANALPKLAVGNDDSAALPPGETLPKIPSPPAGPGREGKASAPERKPGIRPITVDEAVAFLNTLDRRFEPLTDIQKMEKRVEGLGAIAEELVKTGKITGPPEQVKIAWWDEGTDTIHYSLDIEAMRGILQERGFTYEQAEDVIAFIIQHEELHQGNPKLTDLQILRAQYRHSHYLSTAKPILRLRQKIAWLLAVSAVFCAVLLWGQHILMHFFSTQATFLDLLRVSTASHPLAISIIIAMLLLPLSNLIGQYLAHPHGEYCWRQGLMALGMGVPMGIVFSALIYALALLKTFLLLYLPATIVLILLVAILTPLRLRISNILNMYIPTLTEKLFFSGAEVCRFSVAAQRIKDQDTFLMLLPIHLLVNSLILHYLPPTGQAAAILITQLGFNSLRSTMANLPVLNLWGRFRALVFSRQAEDARDEPAGRHRVDRRDFIRLGTAATGRVVAGPGTPESPETDYTGGLPPGHPLLRLLEDRYLKAFLQPWRYSSIIEDMQFFRKLTPDRIESGFEDDIWSWGLGLAMDDETLLEGMTPEEQQEAYVRCQIGGLARCLKELECGCRILEYEDEPPLSPEEAAAARQSIAVNLFMPVARAFRILREKGMGHLVDELEGLIAEQAVAEAAKAYSRKLTDEAWAHVQSMRAMRVQSDSVPVQPSQAVKPVYPKLPLPDADISAIVRRAADEAQMPIDNAAFQVILEPEAERRSAESLRARLSVVLHPLLFMPQWHQPGIFEIAWAEVLLSRSMWQPQQPALFEVEPQILKNRVVHPNFRGCGLEDFLDEVVGSLSKSKGIYGFGGVSNLGAFLPLVFGSMFAWLFSSTLMPAGPPLLSQLSAFSHQLSTILSHVLTFLAPLTHLTLNTLHLPVSLGWLAAAAGCVAGLPTFFAAAAMDLGTMTCKNKTSAASHVRRRFSHLSKFLDSPSIIRERKFVILPPHDIFDENTSLFLAQNHLHNDTQLRRSLKPFPRSGVVKPARRSKHTLKLQIIGLPSGRIYFGRLENQILLRSANGNELLFWIYESESGYEAAFKFCLDYFMGHYVYTPSETARIEPPDDRRIYTIDLRQLTDQLISVKNFFDASSYVPDIGLLEHELALAQKAAATGKIYTPPYDDGFPDDLVVLEEGCEWIAAYEDWLTRRIENARRKPQDAGRDRAPGHRRSPHRGSLGIAVLAVGLIVVALLAPAIMSGQLFVVLEHLWAQLPHLPAHALVAGLPAPLEMLKCIFGTSFLTGPANVLVAGLPAWVGAVMAVGVESSAPRQEVQGGLGLPIDKQLLQLLLDNPEVRLSITRRELLFKLYGGDFSNDGLASTPRGKALALAFYQAALNAFLRDIDQIREMGGELIGLLGSMACKGGRLGVYPAEAEFKYIERMQVHHEEAQSVWVMQPSDLDMSYRLATGPLYERASDLLMACLESIFIEFGVYIHLHGPLQKDAYNMLEINQASGYGLTKMISGSAIVHTPGGGKWHRVLEIEGTDYVINNASDYIQVGNVLFLRDGWLPPAAIEDLKAAGKRIVLCKKFYAIPERCDSLSTQHMAVGDNIVFSEAAILGMQLVDLEGKVVLDAGAGPLMRLATAAAVLGASQVIAVDNCPMCDREVVYNGVAHQIVSRQKNFHQLLPSDFPPIDIIVFNQPCMGMAMDMKRSGFNLWQSLSEGVDLRRVEYILVAGSASGESLPEVEDFLRPYGFTLEAVYNTVPIAKIIDEPMTSSPMGELISGVPLAIFHNPQRPSNWKPEPSSGTPEWRGAPQPDNSRMQVLGEAIVAILNAPVVQASDLAAQQASHFAAQAGDIIEGALA